MIVWEDLSSCTGVNANIFLETETRKVSFSASYLHQTVDGKKA